MNPSLKTPAISVVVEWENVLLAEQCRARAMLTELYRQAIQLVANQPVAKSHGPLELLVLFDPAEAAASDVEQAVAACIPVDSVAIAWRLVPVQGATYYRMKNLGAQQARGEIVVLLDSDVIPDDGWLAALVGSLAGGAQVVGGNTYVEPDSFYTRTMALTWFFPLRASRPELRPVTAFYANNVAFRRQVLLDHPFPDREDQSRGACRRLAQRLIAAGITPYINSAAQVGHPPPNGFAHFFLRAAAEGRDQLIDCRSQHPGRKASFPRSVGRALKRWSRAVRRLVHHRGDVSLGWPLVPAAAMVATAYYASYFLGDLAHRVAPGWSQKHIQI